MKSFKDVYETVGSTERWKGKSWRSEISWTCLIFHLGLRSVEAVYIVSFKPVVCFYTRVRSCDQPFREELTSLCCRCQAAQPVKLEGLAAMSINGCVSSPITELPIGARRCGMILNIDSYDYLDYPCHCGLVHRFTMRMKPSYWISSVTNGCALYRDERETYITCLSGGGERSKTPTRYSFEPRKKKAPPLKLHLPLHIGLPRIPPRATPWKWWLVVDIATQLYVPPSETSKQKK
jgi:hypothetical protein